AEVAHFGQLEAILNALGNDKENLVKYLNWETLAKAANKAEVAQLKQVADFISALGNDKENLVKYLNWETLAKAANKAEVAQLKQVADFINALGDDKKNLVKYLNWETLAKAANKAEVAQLAQVADFINALGNDKENLSMYLKEESIITFSENITWKQISSFCIILASIETERRNSVISKCDWVFLLNKINLNHSAQIKSLSYILNYQNKKQAILNLTLKNELLNTYLVKNKDEIVRFSTQFFIIPNDFQSCSNLITALIPHSSELCQNIVDKTKYKIIKEFNISPRYYKSFSNLLNTIYQINPLASKYIITNNLVKSALFVSFKDEGINEQLVGLQSLLDSIKNIDPLGITEITSLQCIKDLGLKDIRDN
ncbi:MAG: hypothetical protein HYZ15_00300, partial [Sphingobacteriales bacterium]|nr:hypothetical protein [Sphingobacteriales bacterium]